MAACVIRKYVPHWFEIYTVSVPSQLIEESKKLLGGRQQNLLVLHCSFQNKRSFKTIDCIVR